ncbi:toxic anion resistance protein [Pseudomonas sp. CFBP 13602]|uniref:toxic anion resistance protein n=1 Tax=Pseudomonas sp. CFBP 13602 TaxID=2774039 RepID=UPI00177D7E55|nr:toxic anion resistance protein [Pseudomonas sp. CFBP 13602]MBD8828990.1 toxic anion resistance protein [Pseudomonas sp. CFBP 13602]
MTDMIAELKADVLPALFKGDASAIGEYGGGTSAVALNDFSNLMEAGSVSALADRISGIVAKLSEADPQRIAKPANWLERFTGSAIERQAKYTAARKSLDSQIADTEAVAQRVRDTVAALTKMVAGHADEAHKLKAYIQAGREFLDENPDAGRVLDGDMEFDRPRERFARKLANLATLLSSHEMSVMQMKLTRASAVDMLDRFNETVSVLVPVWRQHTLSLLTTKHMDQKMVAEATKAHQALMRSLSQSLEGIEK